LKGDAARAAFIERFREVQRLKTQLDQYTYLTPETETEVEQLLPKDELNAFRRVYLQTAQELKERQGKGGDAPTSPVVEELDFEFVLFASADIDYDYIMALLARFSQVTPSKQSMNRDQLIGLIQADAKFLDERDTITDFIKGHRPGPFGGMNRAFSPRFRFVPRSWGVAPGWYGSGPLALKTPAQSFSHENHAERRQTKPHAQAALSGVSERGGVFPFQKLMSNSASPVAFSRSTS